VDGPRAEGVRLNLSGRGPRLATRRPNRGRATRSATSAAGFVSVATAVAVATLSLVLALRRAYLRGAVTTGDVTS
jgi:hypothetical protein